MTESQIVRVNGMANDYWGWGREDDDLSTRFRHYNFRIIYSDSTAASYVDLGHKSDRIITNHEWPSSQLVAKVIESNGLSNLNYTLNAIENRPLYTNISVYL